MPTPSRYLRKVDIPPNLDPASGRSAVLGRNAFGKPGDCATARHSSGKANSVFGQDPSMRASTGRISRR